MQAGHSSRNTGMILKNFLLYLSAIVVFTAACSFSSSEPSTQNPANPASGSNTNPTSSHFAEAGDNQAVLPNALVTLSAVGSSPVDEISAYDWEIISVEGDNNIAAALALNATDTNTLTFTSPAGQTLTTDTVVRFQLTVTFSTGGQAVDTVDITFTRGSLAVSAGNDQNTTSDQTVNLNATVTSSGAVTNLLWIQVGGSVNVPLTGATSSNVSFAAPWLDPANNELTFRLIANDDQGNTSFDDVTVRVFNNRPNANAGQDQLVRQGTQVTLNGSGSQTTDGQGLPALQWRLVSGGPIGFTFGPTASPTPQFVAPNLTDTDRATLVFEVSATEGAITDVDLVTITVVSELTYNDFGGRFYGVEIDPTQSRAYVATGEGGLGIFDLTSPDTPVLLGVFNAPGNTQDVALLGQNAYLVDRFNGLFIIDISSPSAPFAVSQIATPGNPQDVILRNDHAFIADSSGGLTIINVTDPQAPVQAGRLDTPNQALGVDISADGNTAYVADDRTGLIIIDISAPTTPVEISTLDTLGRTNSVIANGDIVYLADGDQGLQVVDVSNPQAPLLAKTLDTPGFATKLKLENGLLFLSDQNEGVHVYSVAVANTPVLIGSFNTSGSAEDTAVLGANLVVADNQGGLKVIDSSNPANLVETGSYLTIGQGFGVEIRDDHMFVADFFNGLFILDVANPLSPRLVSQLSLSGRSQDVAIDGNFVFIADDAEGLKIIDISNIASPTLVGASAIQDDNAKGILVANGVAYIAADHGGLVTMDVSIPSAPVLLDSEEFGPSGSQSKDLFLLNNYAFVANGDQSFAISNISNPSAITSEAFLKEEFSQIPRGDGHSIAVSGIYAYLAHNARDLAIINVQNPANPTIFKEVLIDGNRKTVNTVLIKDKILFANNSNVDTDDRAADDELWIWNIDDPVNVTSVPDGSFPIGGRYPAMAVNGNGTFLFMVGEGVKVLDISDPFNPHQ
jgi:hypothetical protein